MLELRPIGILRGTLAGQWNLDFSKHRRQNARRTMRLNLRCEPKGRGRKAWRRWERMFTGPSILVWPDYLR